MVRGGSIALVAGGTSKSSCSSRTQCNAPLRVKRVVCAISVDFSALFFLVGPVVLLILWIVIVITKYTKAETLHASVSRLSALHSALAPLSLALGISLALRNLSACLEHSVGEVIDARVAHLFVRVVWGHFLSAHVAKVGAIAQARNAIRHLVNHVIARARVVLLDELVAAGTTLCGTFSAPLVQCVVHLVEGAAAAKVPALLAPHAKALNAVRTLDHADGSLEREIDKILAKDASHPLSIRGSV